MTSQVMRCQQALVSQNAGRRYFSAGEVQAPEEPQESSLADINTRVGADNTFDENKHGYVLTFPWNFEEVVAQAEADHSVMSESSYWHKFMTNTRSIVDLNNVFREFHQACAIPDHKALKNICEPKLASMVSDSLRRIHFHGLDVEMANLTVEQPSIRILKAEVHQGLNLDRSQNLPLNAYNVTGNHSISGAPWRTYSSKTNDRRHFLDVLEADTHRNYLVQLTCVVESPMKLFVYN